MTPDSRTPRRKFLAGAAAVSSLSTLGEGASREPASSAPLPRSECISLDGTWWFRIDPQNIGGTQNWFASLTREGWREVKVPHTWQIEPENADYRGVAWYRRDFHAPEQWAGQFARIEFEAVFHTATVWVNGGVIGRHVGKGYTAFTLDVGPRLQPGRTNNIAVRVDNTFDQNMLPRGRSSDWAHDGGIYRSVQLLVTPATFIEKIAIDAVPDLGSRSASVQLAATIRNASNTPYTGGMIAGIIEEQTGLPAVSPGRVALSLAAGERRLVKFPLITMPEAKLWNVDTPDLYRLTAELSGGHTLSSAFGVRKIETRDGSFFVNGERVRLMGVERMAGSNPTFGMAEPLEWIEHDHADLKNLNCVYTRVHWQQDRRVLDWCDRHGIFIQTEVPTWGSATFDGMTGEPSSAIMNNGLEQLREMIERDRNHPSIFSWGVCNEIGGQNPPAYTFAQRMYEEAKRLDPNRLVSYASSSLYQNPGKDVSGLMDYIMWNEYYESWHPGTTADVLRNVDEIHAAFPGKAIVISEYGYCACTADRPEGDASRERVLTTHDDVYRERDFVAGLIFFCYNDYRTHVGDRGTGACQQRVHGVVDLYGEPKPSWLTLRTQASPVDSLRVTGKGKPPILQVSVTTRASIPAYTLSGYNLRAIAYGSGNIPVEQLTVPLEDIPPGRSAHVTLTFSTAEPLKIVLDVMRPTGFSTLSEVWSY